MSFDRTENQNTENLQDARARSLDSSSPPAEVEGYLLQEFLGSGAFGQVWSAVDQGTGRRVAIKFYNRRSVGDIGPLAREVQKLVVLSADRHVVQLLDVGWEADPPYYVMEYLPRGSLEDLLRREKTLSVETALNIAEEVATGLMHLHGKGILHCDLKPGNVLLDNDDKPRLADFGQSRLSSEATPSLGTLFYMAPEQADLEASPDARWDVYALGALLYVMLTGRPPHFDNTLTTELESSGDIRSRLSRYRKWISQTGTPRGHRQVPGVDRSLAEIVDRCIAADPRKRYSSVQSVILAFRQRSEMLARRPLVMLGMVGPLILFAVISFFGWTAYRQAINDTDLAIRSKAVESNLFAARLAARSAAEQMDEYFRAVDQMTQTSDFVADLQRCLDDEELSEMRLKLANPSENLDAKLDETRTRFRSHPVRLALQYHLKKRMAELPLGQVNSWWVYDLYGNQLGSVFATSADTSKSDVKNTIGLNYSFRTYFTGLEEELYQTVPGNPVVYNVAQDPEKRVHLQDANLSAVFKSEATGTWKIAFSAPIKVDGEIIGIVGLTVQMGDFVDFDAGENQYAMMYDTRPGEHQGIILEHPLLDKQRREFGRIEGELIECRMAEPPSPGSRFRDPIGETSAGSSYRRESVASEAPVEFTTFSDDPTTGLRTESRRDSGLNIVVLEDYEKVVEPAHVLGQRLSRLAAWATALMAVVATVMWYVVIRLLRHSRKQLARSFTSQGGAGVDSSFGTNSASEDRGLTPSVSITSKSTRDTELGN